MASTGKSLPSHSGPPPTNNKAPGTSSTTSSASPSPTLYLTNLPEKIRKPDLRTALYMLFSSYGVVLDINAMRGNKMRGQAHVVMRDINASTQAMRALQGFDFFGKEMKIRYSDNKKGRSHVFNKLEGEFKDATTGTAGAGGEADGTEPGKKISAFEAPRPGQQQTEAEKAGPGLQVKAPGQQDSEAHGTKRPREEEDEEDQEAPMDEEDDDDVDMEQSDSD